MSVDLEALKTEVEEMGEESRNLKAAPEVDKNVISAAVRSLNEAKKKYADNNNGVGVDGKPYAAPMPKSEKKAKEKAEKAGAAGQPRPQQDNNPGSANFKKKETKKAASQAKKVSVEEAANSAPPSVAGAGGHFSLQSSAKAPPSPAGISMPPTKQTSAEGFQILVNPNLPMSERPIVSLAVATLTNTILEYKVASDHRSRQATMGLSDGSSVVGDFAIARYIARRAATSSVAANLLPDSPSQLAIIDAWIDYAQAFRLFGDQQKIPTLCLTLMHAVQQQTYVVGSKMTMADVALFAAFGFPTETERYENVKSYLPSDSVPVLRWIDMMRNSPGLREAQMVCLSLANNAEPVFDQGGVVAELVSGMDLLEGGIAGRIVTRFPPEPSGYLHIGHSKAVLLNDYYARRYNGRLIVRFDDTNPSKEKEEYQQSIVEDLGILGVKPDMVTYTSDYFGAFLQYAEFMIEKGLAYMDDTPQEQMKIDRNDRKESIHRTQTSAEAKSYFDLMCKGSKEGSRWCLRAKIDMSSDNGTLRDPVMYRQNLSPHHRTGITYKAYPTYDMACPIIDSLEGVSHAMRTTEYLDRDEQYQWIQKALNLRRVRIHAFSRVNFTNTVLSKRKLAWFVENGYVTGWDDARFPTVRGVVRRGINIAALRGFMYSQGASRRVVNMVWNSFWAENKKEIDKNAKRFMAINEDRHICLRIIGSPEEEDHAYAETQFHPKNPDLGTRLVRISSDVILESVDMEGIEIGENIVLLRWGVVNITKVEGGLEGTYVPDGDFKAAKKKLSWLAKVSNTTPTVLTEFDNLICKEKLEEEDKFEDFLNPNTLAITRATGDAGLKSLVKDDVIQLERRGYYRVDSPFVSNEKPLILYMVPDGKSKAMWGLSGKLAHR